MSKPIFRVFVRPDFGLKTGMGPPKGSKKGKVLPRRAKRPQSEAIALRLLVQVFCGVLLLIPAASTVSDPLQALVARSLAASGGAPLPEMQTRASLLRRVAGDTNGLSGMKDAHIRLLFGEPDLVRREGEAISLHYTSPECALDVYYSQGRIRPDYVEYRLKGDGQGVAAYQACLQSLFEGARFENAVPAKPVDANAAADGRV